MGFKGRKCNKPVRRLDGSQMIELVGAVPLMLMLLFGLVDAVNYSLATNKMKAAADAAAEYISLQVNRAHPEDMASDFSGETLVAGDRAKTPVQIVRRISSGEEDGLYDYVEKAANIALDDANGYKVSFYKAGTTEADSQVIYDEYSVRVDKSGVAVKTREDGTQYIEIQETGKSSIYAGRDFSESKKRRATTYYTQVTASMKIHMFSTGLLALPIFNWARTGTGNLLGIADKKGNVTVSQHADICLTRPVILS